MVIKLYAGQMYDHRAKRFANNRHHVETIDAALKSGKLTSFI